MAVNITPDSKKNVTTTPDSRKNVTINTETKKVTVNTQSDNSVANNVSVPSGDTYVNVTPDSNKNVTATTETKQVSVSTQSVNSVSVSSERTTSVVNVTALGPQGIQGPQGIAGPTGSLGPLGPEGPTGAQGIQGIAGPSGSAFFTGGEIRSDTSVTGSFTVSSSNVDFSEATSITGSVFTGIFQGALSSSEQISSNISGSTNSLSSSLSTRLTTDESNITNLQTDSGSFSTRITSAETELSNTLISSSAQISTDISGSFTSPSASISTRLTTAETELSNTLISSSAQISTDISGSFIEPSASISTRLTTAESELSNTLISSSAQISTDISGSFIEPSASISTRLTTNETDITNLQTDSGSFSTRITSAETELSNTLISGSTQITQLGFVSESFSTGGTGIISGSEQLPTGLVSSSAQSVTHITGADLDMGGNKVLFSNVYSTEGDLPSASTYHGMFAHVHATGRGYFAHAGAWHPLVNLSEGVISGSAQIATDISGSFVADSGSFSTRLTTAESELNNTLISSSAQISTEISGSFTAPSASISTRLTTAETELSNTLISSSAQIATEISGSFTTPSASISTRLTTAESELSNTLISSSAQIASDISGSFGNQRVGTTDNVNFASVTTSGNVNVGGNLDVSGTTTSIDSATLNIGDKNITIGSGSTTSAQLDEAGIDFGLGGDVSNLRYRHSDTSITSSVDFRAPNFYGIFNGALSSSAQISSDISGSFTAASSSFSTRITTAETELGNTLISSSAQVDHDTTTNFVSNEHIDHSGVTLTAGDGLSGGGDITTNRSFAVDNSVLRTTGDNVVTSSAQISTDISGSFTAASSSISTRLTTAESELGNTLISSSAQIASDISGSFTQPSASISTRLTTEESNIDTLQGRTLTAGDGLTGGGTLESDRTFAVDSSVLRTTGDNIISGSTQITGFGFISGSLSGTLSSSAQIAEDISGSFVAPSASISTRLTTAESELSNTLVSSSVQVDHDATTNFVANEHIDHSTVSISAGGILSGGGTIASNRTITLASSDVVHDSTSGFVSNEHIDHTSITLTAGDGLSGGGDISSNRSFAVDNTVLRTTGDNVLSGSAQIATDISGSFIEVSSSLASRISSNETGNITSVTAGNGLTGGGSSGGVTLNVVGGTGIDANSNDIAIDSTVTTLTGTQTLTNKTLTSPTFSGDIDFSDATSPSLTITDSTNTAQLRLTATDTTTDIGSLSAHKVNFRYNNDIRLQLEDTKFMVNAGSDDMDFTVKDASGLQALHIDAGVGDVNIRTLDVSGDADIDGTLETDALTIGGVTSVPFESADHTKLDGIESSATADQTNAEIRTAVEAATDSNVFTDADHSKLNAIEASADVTDTGNVHPILDAKGVISSSNQLSSDISGSFTAGTGLDLSSGEFSVDVSDFMTNGSNNRILTATGTDGQNAEANFTIDGTSLQLGDGKILSLGNSDDLQIHHTTNQNIVELNTGNLTFRDESDNNIMRINKAGGVDILEGNLTVAGNLDIQGTTTTIDSTEVSLGDRILTLNAGSAAGDGGLYVNDASTAETGSLLWDISEDRWIGGLKDSEVNLVTISSTDTLTNKTINASNNTLSNIGNSSLTNSSVNYGGVSVSLGGSDTTPAFDLSDATSLPIVAGTSGTLSVARGGTGATTFTSNTLLTGNGTSAIQSESELTYDAGQFKISRTSGTAVLRIQSDDSNPRIYFNEGNTTRANLGYSISNNRFELYASGSTPFSIEDGAGSNTLVVDSNSRVGIGTVSPSTDLHINTTDDGSVTFTRGGSHKYSIEHDTSQLYLYNRTINKNAIEFAHSGPVTINEDGHSTIDFRVEGDTNPYLLFTDASTDRVGIGTGSPAAFLDVSRDNSNSGNQFVVADTEGASAAVRTYTTSSPAGLILNHYYAVGGGGNQYMRYADFVANVGSGAGTTMRFITKNSSNAYSTTVIDNNGNVGIGTNSPDTLLHLNEDDSAVAFKVTGGSGGAKIASFIRDVGVSSPYAETYIHAGSGDPQITFRDIGNTTYSIGLDDSANAFKISEHTGVGTNDRIVVNDSGTVYIPSSVRADGLGLGIGDNTPQNTLHVDGGNNNVVARFNGTSTFTFVDLYNDGTNRVQLGNADDGDFIIRTNDAERFRVEKTTGDVIIKKHLELPYGEINDAGTDLNIVGTNAVTLQTSAGTAITIPNASTNVGIGTTPSTKVHVKDASNDLYFRLETDKVNGNAQVQYFNDARSYNLGINNIDRFSLWDNTASETRFDIDTDGDFKFYASGSDFQSVGGGTGNTYLLVSGNATQRIEFRNTDTNANGWIGIPSWNTDAWHFYGPTSNGNELAYIYESSRHNYYRGFTINNGGDDYDFIVKGQNDDTLLYTDASTDRVGIGTSSIGELLHVDGSIEFAGRKYNRGTVSVAGAGSGNGQAITLSTELGTTLHVNYQYKITLNTTGTGTDTGAVYILTYDQDGGAWDLHLVSRNGSSSNHPLAIVDGSNLKAYHNHSSTYNILYFVELWDMAADDGTLHGWGSDYQWTRDVDTLSYSAGDVNIDSGTFYVDVSTNRVGLLDTSPDATLQIGSGTDGKLFHTDGLYNDVTFNGGSGGTSGVWEFVNSGTWGQTRFYVQDANNSADRLTFDFRGNGTANKILAGTSTGNVGVGTTSPAQKLHVAGNVMISNNTFFMGEDADGDDIGLLGIHSNNNVYIGPKDNAYAGGFMLYGAASSTSGHVWYSGNAEAMRIDSSQNVGIGTNSPGGKLDIKGSASANNLTISADMHTVGGGHLSNYQTLLFANTTNNTGYAAIRHFANSHNDSASQLRFLTSNTSGTLSNQMTIDDTGFVGIGTTTPGYKLHVNDGSTKISSTGNTTLFIDGAGNGYTSGQIVFQGSDDDASYRGTGVFNHDAASDIEYFSGTLYANDAWAVCRKTSVASHDSSVAQGSNALFIIEGGGDVGIGLSNPQNKFTVNDTGTHQASIQYDASTRLQISVESSGRARFYTDNSANVGIESGGLYVQPTQKLFLDGGNDTFIKESSANVMEFYCGNSRRMQLTTTYLAVPDNAYLAAGDNNEVFIRHDGNGHFQSNGGQMYINNVATTNIIISVGNDEKVRIENDGDMHVKADVVAFSSVPSDIRLKKNFTKIDNGLDIISKLDGQTFNWKKGGDRLSAGFKAQEVEKVLPHLVDERELPLHSDDEKDYKVLRYEEIIPYLVESIKELKTTVEEQQKEIKDLKNKL